MNDFVPPSDDLMGARRANGGERPSIAGTCKKRGDFRIFGPDFLDFPGARRAPQIPEPAVAAPP
jgi:hypothetical protein